MKLFRCSFTYNGRYLNYEAIIISLFAQAMDNEILEENQPNVVAREISI